jgi:predicted acylesterase/phospholipase RssA
VSKERALYLSRPVTSSPIGLSHQHLGQLGDLKDYNTREVVSHVENLFQIIETPEFRRADAIPTVPRGLNLLSFDGGGVKGLFSLIVLERLMAEAQRLDGSTEFKKLPCEYFDLIGGTSTGGLIAIMLGRLQMDIPSCIEAYRNLSIGIFRRFTDAIPMANFVRNATNALLGNSLFEAEPLEVAICKMVGQHITVQERDNVANAHMSARDVRLFSTEVQKAQCFVCAVSEGQHNAVRIRSYLPRHLNQRDTSSYTILQAACATSAAPVYFPAIEIQGNHYFDGGLSVNNPMLEVIEEAWDQFPGINIDTIVSIGAGKGPLAEPLPPIWTMMSAIIGRLTSTEAQHDRFMTEDRFEALRPIFSRFQETERLGKIDLAASDKLDEIEKLARDYVALPDVKREITACAERLVNSCHSRR